MRAWVLEEPGGPEAFVLRERPIPEPKDGWVVIRIRAFGLNRSEWFTRMGESPTVKLPRVIGIECTGEVVADPSGSLPVGQRVAALMGGMGRKFDGSYAEYTRVPMPSVFPIESDLDWAVFGALPEMLQTTHGSLYTSLDIQPGETLLVRGGTTSIGLMALAIAKNAGLRVATTTRNPAKKAFLLEAGADEVYVDDGGFAAQIRRVHPDGVDRLLEMIGTETLLDSLQCVRTRGVVCVTGILGGEWMDRFFPMGHIPLGVRLTSYAGGSMDITQERLQHYYDLVAAGELRPPTGPVFQFEELIEAHRRMDANTANGKMVVLVG